MVACQTSSEGSGPGNAANLSTETNGGQPVDKQGNMDICSTYGDLARLCRQGGVLHTIGSPGTTLKQGPKVHSRIVEAELESTMSSSERGMKIHVVRAGFGSNTSFRKCLEGVKPDKVTFNTALNACASLAVLDKGKRVHACIVKAGLEKDVFVGNFLVNMYSKSGSLQDARQAFDNISYV
ncbi:unnamed protein product [Sphagnum balticum]